jgi:hypothetical protein
MKPTVNRYLNHLGLLISCLAAMFSGLLIQVNYHMGNHGSIEISDRVLGLNYAGWSAFHKISIVILFALMLFHFYRHLKWYKNVIVKKLLTRNSQVIILSVLFILVAITGFTPWFIHLLKGDEMVRKTFIEIHDKLALLLSVFLLLHIAKRLKWFIWRSLFRQG